ncbi:protein jag, partial [Selenomonadales bacterium OttesenSCG-928-I06]|nr:protein jag [Selenomonadales bacterium OttesenSCG-928-I06]
MTFDSDKKNDFIEATGKTVEEALSKALQELNVTEDRINYEILEKPSKGILGFGSKVAKIRVTLLVKDPIDKATDFLKEIFETLKIDVSFDVVKKEVAYEEDYKNLSRDDDNKKDNSKYNKERSHYVINLKGNNIGMMIGKHGQTLDALNYLTSIVANNESDERIRVVLDIEGYRSRREDTLRKLALRLADKVKNRMGKVVLEPMNPQERKIIHTAL